MIDVCKTKRFFDTEFAATINAAKVTGAVGQEMEAYQCGTHWHITHVNPKERRGAGHDYWRCPKCKKIESRKHASQHKCVIKEKA